MGARGGGGSRGGRAGGGGYVGLAKAAQRAFYSQGVSDYFNGSNSASAKKAYADYQQKLGAFKDAWTAKGGGRVAFDDWSSAMNDVANGNVRLGK